MAETQNIEYKEAWRDEYLKWVCGFANAQGGSIYIGLKDDGQVVGVANSKKLMEDIPNKIRNTMGIITDVNLLQKDGKEFIEIKVNPSSYPVNYLGEYHIRSGSTKQQLRGSALTAFLMEKTGFRWDAVPVDDITVEDLDQESFNIFRREAVRNGRMSKEVLDISNHELLDSLDLLVGGKLKRAAVMLFHHRPGRVAANSYVKIGRFGEGSDLQYQDTVEGSLFQMADKVIDLIYMKYLKAAISYQHDVRVETYPFPREAVREAIYNALGHNNYGDGVPIQVRIEDEAMYISNNCVLPKDWTEDTLLQKHKSVPFNPSIANAFYRAGYIEAWGRGIQKMIEACRALGTPDPEYTVLGNDLTVKLTALARAIVSEPKVPKDQDDTKDDTKDDALENVLGRKILVLLEMNAKLTQEEIALRLDSSIATIKRAMKKLVDDGSIIREGGKRFGSWKVN